MMNTLKSRTFAGISIFIVIAMLSTLWVYGDEGVHSGSDDEEKSGIVVTTTEYKIEKEKKAEKTEKEKKEVIKVVKKVDFLTHHEKNQLARKIEYLKPYQNVVFLKEVLARVIKLEESTKASEMTSVRKTIRLGRLLEMRAMLEARIAVLTGSGTTTTPPVVTDTTAPKLSKLTLTGVTATGVIISVVSNESGTGHYVILGTGTESPSAKEIKAGQDGSGTGVTMHGSFVIGTWTTLLELTGLTPETAYKVYITAEDAAGNLAHPRHTETIITLTGSTAQ